MVIANCQTGATTEWTESGGEWIPKPALSKIKSADSKPRAKSKRIATSTRKRSGGQSARVLNGRNGHKNGLKNVRNRNLNGNATKNRVWLLAEREHRNCISPMTYTRHFPDPSPVDPLSFRSDSNDSPPSISQEADRQESGDKMPSLKLSDGMKATKGTKIRNGINGMNGVNAGSSDEGGIGSGVDTVTPVPNTVTPPLTVGSGGGGGIKYYSLYTKQSMEQIGGMGIEEESMQREVALADLPESHSVQPDVDAVDTLCGARCRSESSPSPKLRPLNKVGTIGDAAEFSDTELPKSMTGRTSISSYFTRKKGRKSTVSQIISQFESNQSKPEDDTRKRSKRQRRKRSKRRKRTWTGAGRGVRGRSRSAQRITVGIQSDIV